MKIKGGRPIDRCWRGCGILQYKPALRQKKCGAVAPILIDCGAFILPVRTTPDRLNRFDLHSSQVLGEPAVFKPCFFQIPSHFWHVWRVAPRHKGKMFAGWVAFAIPQGRPRSKMAGDEVLPPLSVGCANGCRVVDVAHQIHFCEALRGRCGYSTPCRQ